MKIVAENDKYKVMDCRGTNYSSNWQLLEITKDYCKGETIGEYQYKKDAIEMFNNLSIKYGIKKRKK
jgi:hypothetical protein